MKRKPAQVPHDSLRIVFIFCIVVFILIAISLSYRFFMLLRDSKFDGVHRFTIAVMYEDSKKADVLSFEPQSNTLSSVAIQSRATLPAIEKVLGIPIDGVVFERGENQVEEETHDKIAQHIYRIGGQKKNITQIDLIRLALYAGGVQKKDTVTEEIDYPQDASVIDEKLSDIYFDRSIVDEEAEIEIINAAGVSGLGGRVERMLSNMGATVVAVTTAPTMRDSSEIQYFTDNSYTVERLGRVFNYPLIKKDNKTISDIIIILGRDSSFSKIF